MIALFLLHLPNELLSKICSYIYKKSDILSFKLTCKKFLNVSYYGLIYIKDAPFTLPSLILDYDAEYGLYDNHMIYFIRSYKKYYRYKLPTESWLSLHKYVKYIDLPFFVENTPQLEDYLMAMSNIENISICTHNNDMRLLNCLTRCTKLKKFNYYVICSKFMPPSQHIMLNNNKLYVKNLTMSDQFVNYIIMFKNKLKINELYIGYVFPSLVEYLINMRSNITYPNKIIHKRDNLITIENVIIYNPIHSSSDNEILYPIAKETRNNDIKEYFKKCGNVTLINNYDVLTDKIVKSFGNNL